MKNREKQELGQWGNDWKWENFDIKIKSFGGGSDIKLVREWFTWKEREGEKCENSGEDERATHWIWSVKIENFEEEEGEGGVWFERVQRTLLFFLAKRQL